MMGGWGAATCALPPLRITWSSRLEEDSDNSSWQPPASLSQAFGRRFAFGVASGLAVAVGGNLGGITSLLLGLNPAFSQSLKLDALYPVNGFKRCIEKDFEFLYPATWVGDQRLLYRAAERAERERLSDFELKTEVTPKRSAIEPIVAFGPAGSSGELNVSVIVAPIPLDFRIEKIGGPKEVGELILNSFIASKRQKITPMLINAFRRDEVQKGERVLYYCLEYLVAGQSFLRHNIAVYAAHNGQLLSFNVQTPEALWAGLEQQFQEMANSFRVSV